VDMNLNVLELQLKCQKLLAQISRSEKLLPAQLVDVLAHVKTTMERKFPKSVYIAFGNFLFLRFISPAIVSPEGFGLSNDWQVNEKVRRTLVLMGKVLQNLANKREFGTKEEFMIPLNSFIQANENTLNGFYTRMLECKDNDSEEFRVPNNVYDDSLAVLHNLCRQFEVPLAEGLKKTDAKLAEKVSLLLHEFPVSDGNSSTRTSVNMRSSQRSQSGVSLTSLSDKP